MGSTVSSIFFIVSVLLKAQDPFGNDISGDNQIGEVAGALKKPIAVRVIDNSGIPKSHATVVFSILDEPKENTVLKQFAKLESDTVITNIDGYAMTRLRFGGSKGHYCIIAQSQNQSVLFNAMALDKNWFLFFLFSIFGGLALFVFGVNYGSKGLIREMGPKMRDIIFSLTANRFTALLMGILVTAIFGSSTATAVLLVRFASSGIVTLNQALGILLGADIGTTITVQILAFNILSYAILIVGVGIFLKQLFPRLRNLGQFIFGLGLLFFSLQIMSNGASNLKYLPNFNGVINSLGSNSILGIITGAIVALVLHSSAATIGVLLILGFGSLISLSAAIPLVLGANLGATVSSLFAADTVDGRRVAFGHFIFKLTTIIILFPFLAYIPKIVNRFGGDTARQIANLHTLFNIFTAIIFLPLFNLVTAFLKSSVRETKKELLKIKRLDPLFLTTPLIALGQATREILQMADIVIKMLEDTIKVFENKDNNLRKKIIQTDDEIDAFEEAITPYLTKINHEEMDNRLSRLHSSLLHTVASLEHIGDIISKSLMSYAKKQIDSGFAFSTEGFSEIKEFHNFVLTTLRISTNGLATRNKKLVTETVARRAIGYSKAKGYEAHHLFRLTQGLKESLETSTVHLDIINDLERINFHASEIGKVIL